MKKLATILMLVAVILAGGMSMDAQNKISRKKTQTKTSQNKTKDLQPEDFVADYNEYYTKPYDVYGVEDPDIIRKRLVSSGFKIKELPGSLDVSWEALPVSSNSKIKKITCSDDNFVIIAIIFKTREDAVDFYNKIKKYNNYNESGQTEGYGWELNGNTVSSFWDGMP